MESVLSPEPSFVTLPALAHAPGPGLFSLPRAVCSAIFAWWRCRNRPSAGTECPNFCLSSVECRGCAFHYWDDVSGHLADPANSLWPHCAGYFVACPARWRSPSRPRILRAWLGRACTRAVGDDGVSGRRGSRCHARRAAAAPGAGETYTAQLPAPRAPRTARSPNGCEGALGPGPRRPGRQVGAERSACQDGAVGRPAGVLTARRRWRTVCGLVEYPPYCP